MSDVIISVENLSKRYRLGQIGATTLRESVERCLAGIRKAKRDHRHETIDPEGKTQDHRPKTIDHGIEASSGLKSNVHGLRSEPAAPADSGHSVNSV